MGPSLDSAISAAIKDMLRSGILGRFVNIYYIIHVLLMISLDVSSIMGEKTCGELL